MKFNDKSQQYIVSLFKQHKPLSREEEQKLFRMLPNKQAREKIINSNLMFVLKVVHQYHHYEVEFIDAVQEGILGLTIAVEKFNPDRGFKFITYAIWWVKAYVTKYIERNISVVRVNTTQSHRKLFWKLRSTIAMLDKLTHSESMEEAAKVLNVPLKDVEYMSTRLLRPDVSLEGRNSFDDGDEGRPFSDILPSNEEPVDEQVMREDVNRIVRDIFNSSLQPRAKYVLYETIINDRTLNDVGQDLNVSRERVRQIQSTNLAKLGRSLRFNAVGTSR